MKSRPTLVFGSRRSELAQWQTAAVIKALQPLVPNVECTTRLFATRGDSNLSKPIIEFTGKGLFTSELDQAIRSSEIDLAVHSLKDLPVTVENGLRIVPVLAREDASDVLVTKTGCNLATLPSGSVVGTSSFRRQAQLLALRPDLECRPIRGNVPTRIRKVRDGEFDATLLAAAGVIRLGLQSEVAEWLPIDQMLPAPGQAMLAATCRSDDEFVCGLLCQIQNENDSRCVLAEREVLQQLGGGCLAPIAVHACCTGKTTIALTAMIGLQDGASMLRFADSDDNPIGLARSASWELQQRGSNVYLGRSQPLPLAGKRIVVTRATQQGRELSRLLIHRGGSVLAMPTIEIQSLEVVELPPLATAAWILFTSQNGVRVFAQLLDLNSVELPRGIGIACIGAATAAAAKKYGLDPDFVPRNFSGSDFAKQFTAHLDENGLLEGSNFSRRVLYPSAQETTSNLVELLESSGIEVTRFPIYKTIPVILGTQEFSELNAGIDVVTFASPSAARGFFSQIADSKPLLKVTDDAVFGCIGRGTAAVVESLGYKGCVVTAKRATVAALVEALEDYFIRTL